LPAKLAPGFYLTLRVVNFAGKPRSNGFAPGLEVDN
jgi:hypothetical protein